MFSVKWKYNMIVISWKGSLKNYFEERPKNRKRMVSMERTKDVCGGWVVREPELVAFVQHWSGKNDTELKEYEKPKSEKVCSIVRQRGVSLEEKATGHLTLFLLPLVHYVVCYC